MPESTCNTGNCIEWNKTELFKMTQEGFWPCFHMQNMLKENAPIEWQSVSSPGSHHKVYYDFICVSTTDFMS